MGGVAVARLREVLSRNPLVGTNIALPCYVVTMGASNGNPDHEVRGSIAKKCSLTYRGRNLAEWFTP
jgi:hypothetical protein